MHAARAEHWTSSPAPSCDSILTTLMPPGQAGIRGTAGPLAWLACLGGGRVQWHFSGPAGRARVHPRARRLMHGWAHPAVALGASLQQAASWPVGGCVTRCDCWVDHLNVPPAAAQRSPSSDSGTAMSCRCASGGSLCNVLTALPGGPAPAFTCNVGLRRLSSLKEQHTQKGATPLHARSGWAAVKAGGAEMAWMQHSQSQRASCRL